MSPIPKPPPENHGRRYRLFDVVPFAISLSRRASPESGGEEVPEDSFEMRARVSYHPGHSFSSTPRCGRVPRIRTTLASRGSTGTLFCLGHTFSSQEHTKGDITTLRVPISQFNLQAEDVPPTASDQNPSSVRGWTPVPAAAARGPPGAGRSRRPPPPASAASLRRWGRAGQCSDL